MFLGFSLLFLSGICQGSFGLGYKKYNPFSWEAFWGVYSFFCLAISCVWTFLIEPNTFSIVHVCGRVFVIAFICGLLWGLSTIAFSKSILIVGMSLCFGINMGVSAVVGTLIPFVKSQHTTRAFIYLIAGIVITLIGIFVITKAGMQKEKAHGGSNTMLGVTLAIVSGLCSGIMNVGFDIASPLGNLATNAVSAAAVQWLPVLSGGMIASVICCVILMCKNKTWNTYVKKGAATRFLKLFATSIVWFAALFLYGISAKMLGNYGSSVGWLMFNAAALIVSNIWGIVTGEWKNSKQALKILAVGDVILIIAWAVIMQSIR